MGDGRLTCDERCHAILAAAKAVFAERGFDGATTRELARAAGVSEALLYKHFPSKESLCAAMHRACVKGPLAEEYARVMALEPSTSTLAALVHFLAAALVRGPLRDPEGLLRDRLTARSLLGDGRFAKSLLD